MSNAQIDEASQAWLEIAKKVDEIHKLDSQCELVFGAKSHRFFALPKIDAHELNEFENANNIKLPATYRTYLECFSGGGVGPGYGVSDFKQLITKHDISKPSLLSKPAGSVIDDDINDEHAIHSLNGTIRIATAGNPSDYFLILNGELAGEVFWWNYDDMLGYEGCFTQWFTTWVNNTYTKLINYHAFATVSAGMTWTRVQSIMPTVESHRYQSEGLSRVNFDNTPGYIILNEDGVVVSVSHVENPSL